MPYYKLGEIAFDSENKDFPYYVIRTGAVAEQGGLHFGQESLRFQTIVDACNYLASNIERDRLEIERQVKLKETQ